MKMMKTLLAIVAGTSLIGTSAVAQNKMQPTVPGNPQVKPTRPGGPQIQPPRPQPPRPVKPVPPKPVKPVPPKPVKPRPPVQHHRPVVVHHNYYVWNQYNPGWAYGSAVLYSGTHYRGHYLTVRHSIPDLRQYGFNDRADSLHARGRWQVCSKTHYRGKCATVRGSDPSLGRLTGKVSSIRYVGH